MFFWYDQAIYKKGISARNRLKEIRKNIERGSSVFGVFEQKGNYIYIYIYIYIYVYIYIYIYILYIIYIYLTWRIFLYRVASRMKMVTSKR